MAAFLPLRLTADHLLHFFLLLAARVGTLGLGRGLFARRPLYFLAFLRIFNLLGIGHVVPLWVGAESL